MLTGASAVSTCVGREAEVFWDLLGKFQGLEEYGILCVTDKFGLGLGPCEARLDIGIYHSVVVDAG